MDPADFYTGLVAEAYAPLKAFAQPSEPYEKFITDHGQPALELACGDGEPLLALRGRGLDVDGVAMVPLHIPSPTPPEQFGLRNEKITDGVTLAVTVIDQERDEDLRRQVSTLRYERIDGDRHEVLDRAWLMHWCTVDGFTELVTGTGLQVDSITLADGSPAGPEATDFTVLLRPS
ncbi:hypothetical protein ACQBAR_08840 [Propionibacteriaceae bacterium Y1685]